MSAAPNPNFIKGALRLPADILNRRRAGTQTVTRRTPTQPSVLPRDTAESAVREGVLYDVENTTQSESEPFVVKTVGRDYVPPKPATPALAEMPDESKTAVHRDHTQEKPGKNTRGSSGGWNILSPSKIFPKRRLGRNLWLFVWLVVAIGSAQISLFMNPAVGVYVNAAALLSMLWVAIRNERARQLTIAASIIPMTMLVGLSLPAASVFQRSVTVAVIALLLGLVYQFLFTIDYPKEGTRMHMTRYGYALGIPFAFVIGQLIGLVAIALLGHHYEFRGVPVSLVMMGMVIIAITEEVVFRGLIQQRAMILFHPLVGAILAAVLSTLLSLGHLGSPLGVVIGALIGVSASFLYYKQQNLILTITLNVAAKLTYVVLVVAFVLH